MFPPDPDKVVARVNGRPIHARQIYEVANTNRARLLQQGRSPAEIDNDALLRLSLQALIQGELMVEQAEAEGLDVDPQRVEAELQQARARFKSDEEYRQYLERAGLTEEDVRREGRRKLLMDAYRAFILGQQSPPTEEEIRLFYEQSRELYMEPERVRVAQILIRSSPNDPPDQRSAARARAEQIRARLLAGEAFEDLARKHSEAPSAPKGGDLGFFRRGDMVPKFEEVAFSTPVGEISSVFETPFGFNIVKVLEKREPRPRPLEQVRPDILVRLAKLKEATTLSQALNALLEKARVEILDPALAARADTAPSREDAPTGGS